jgi:hypothetical protein
VGTAAQEDEEGAEPAAAPAEEVEDTQSWRPEVWEVGYLCDGQDQYRSPWCVVKVIEVEVAMLWASMSLSDNPNLNALHDICNRMYL